MRVIATAGHVDHGKSSIVMALTGTDPDRFAEEKRRGLTIDLGFAHAIVDGEAISFVDVPGHVRFLRNMLAGVGGVDACLFVVAATEGWKPQSEEHLRILELVGVRHGIVALTKVDVLDDPDLVELAALEVVDHLAGTFLEGAPIVPVVAPTGVGLDALATALSELARSTPASRDRGRARLWIDRVFSSKGSGTVVTGTLTDGSIAAGDPVVIEPGGRTARVRVVQTTGTVVTVIEPGHRVALNLSGVEHTELARGDAVVAPGRWQATARIDASLTVLGVARPRRLPTRGVRGLHRLGRAPGSPAGARPGVAAARRDRIRAAPPARRPATAAGRPVRAARVRSRRDRRRRRGARRRAARAGVAGPARP